MEAKSNCGEHRTCTESDHFERVMTRLLHRLESIPPHVATVTFWVAFSAVLLAMIFPLWIGTVTGLTDFGGHLQMVDAYVQAGNLPALDERTTVREGLLTPNMLPARLADILYPWVSPTSSIRLFLSLVIVSLGAAILLCLREFNRSRLLVFLCLPFFWGGMTGLGLINYVGVYPCILAGIVFSRRFGRNGKALDTQVVSIQTDEGSIAPIGGIIVSVEVMYNFVRGNT